MLWIVHALAAFVGAAIADWCWAHYNRRCAQGAAVSAAWWSVAIGAIGIGNLLNALEYRSVLPFMFAGYWVGTYFAVKRDHPVEDVTP